MRSSLPKCLALSLLLILAVVAATPVAHAAAAYTPSGSDTGLMAVDACGCCPKTCGGGTFIGCYHSISMPPNAVTCSYQDAKGKFFDCVSCFLADTTTTDATSAALNAIFEKAAPAAATAAR